MSLFQSRLKNGWRRGGFFKIVKFSPHHQLGAPTYPSSAHFFERSSKKPGSASVLFVNELQCFVRPPLASASCTGNQKRHLLFKAPTGALVVMMPYYSIRTVLGKLSGAQFARTCSNRIDTWQIGPRTVGHRTIGPRKVEPWTVGPCGPVAQFS